MLQYFETLQDQNGNALSLDGTATVQVTAYPGGGAVSIYSTNGTAAPIANSTVTADITGQVSFFAPDGAYILTYFLNGTQYKIKSPVQMLDPMGFVVATDTGTANNYVVTSSAYPLSLYVGLKVEVEFANTSTGACTFNLNSTGNQPVIQPGGSAIPAGQIQLGGIYRLEWDGAHWQLFGAQSPPFYGISAAETAAAVTIQSFNYPWGNTIRYGTTGNGTTDDSAGIAASEAQATKGGAGVLIPPGSYVVSRTFAAGDNIGVYISGAGIGATTILPTAAVANLFTFGTAGTQNQGISSLSINAVSATSCAAVVLNNVNGFYSSNLYVTKANIAVTINAGVIQYFTNFQFNASITSAVQLLGGGNDQMFNNGVASSVGFTQPSNGLQISYNFAVWVDNVDWISQGTGCVVNPGPGQYVQWSFITNSAFDTCSNNGLALNPSSGGVVYGFELTASWTSSNTNAGVAMAISTGTINGVRLNGHRSFNNGLQGIVVSAGGTCTNFWFHACDCSGNSQTTTITYAGIEIGAGVSGWAITACRSGQAENFSVTQSWGILVDAGGSNNYQISGNDVRGNSNAAGISDGGTGTVKFVTKNPPFNPISQTTVTVTASPFTYTNNTGDTVVLYIQGGTVSTVKTGSGLQAAAASNVAVPVPQGASIVTTYSSAPTMAYLGT